MHTPGPWHKRKAQLAPIAEMNDYLILAQGSDEGKLHIAEVFSYQSHPVTDGSSDDNARLIVKAPELLAQCENLIDWITRILVAYRDPYLPQYIHQQGLDPNLGNIEDLLNEAQEVVDEAKGE